MSMKFNPSNPIIQLCMKGMALEESGNLADAIATFQQAWDEAGDDYEKFIAAYHVGLRQKNAADQLEWIQKSLDFALKMDDDHVKSAYPTLYRTIAGCYEAIGITDAGPFYHGTKADLHVGDFLVAGGRSNYETDFRMNHIYFTANINGAGLAASLAKGEEEERVYVVEPTGEFEHDPNVTDKKFPGNLSRSYRSKAPLRIIGEVTDWEKLTPAQRQEWEEKLAKNNGEIIN